jgi:ssDNA-binding Zn-finger/Zn-ribbon topoisomerase 1
MIKILSAKMATEQEKNNFFEYIYQKPKDFSTTWVSKNADKIIFDHADYINRFTQDKISKHQEQVAEIEANNNRFEAIRDGYHDNCEFCGAALKYVHTYNFVGCSNYRDTRYSKHTTLNLRPHSALDLTVPKNYLSQIKKKNNYPKEVKVSDIYELLIMRGIELHSDVDGDSFRKGANNQQKAKAQEKMIADQIRSTGWKVSEQPMFFYTLDGDKQRICFPDLLVSNHEVVYVVDIKKSIQQADMYKLDLYEEIIRFIQVKTGDKRDTKSVHIFCETATQMPMFRGYDVTQFINLITGKL